MEELVTFTSSRGLLKSCDGRNKDPISSSALIDDDLLKEHGPGESIYICTDALLNFSAQFLDKIQSPFILITGDSDTPINNNLIRHQPIQKILEHPNLTKWFAQNMIADHPKLHQLPIGMDYHTMWERPGTWGLIQQSPLAQERALVNTLSNSPDFLDRLFAGYCNWHFAIDRGDRRDCLHKIDKSICLIEKNQLPRLSSWQRQAECMFVISPEGAGIDCHRTWEALLLGCVPVLKRSRFTELFSQLPVILLDDWSEFNAQNLIKHAEKIHTKKFNFKPLFLRYWQETIKGKNRFFFPEMTMLEFKRFLCRVSF